MRKVHVDDATVLELVLTRDKLQQLHRELMEELCVVRLGCDYKSSHGIASLDEVRVGTQGRTTRIRRQIGASRRSRSNQLAFGFVVGLFDCADVTIEQQVGVERPPMASASDSTFFSMTVTSKSGSHTVDASKSPITAVRCCCQSIRYADVTSRRSLLGIGRCDRPS